MGSTNMASTTSLGAMRRNFLLRARPQKNLSKKTLLSKQKKSALPLNKKASQSQQKGKKHVPMAKKKKKVNFKTLTHRPNAFMVFVQIMKGKIAFAQHGLNTPAKRGREMGRLYHRLRPDQRLVLAQHAHESKGKTVPITAWMQFCADQRKAAQQAALKKKKGAPKMPNIYDLSQMWRRNKEARATYEQQYVKRCEKLSQMSSSTRKKVSAR